MFACPARLFSFILDTGVDRTDQVRVGNGRCDTVDRPYKHIVVDRGDVSNDGYLLRVLCQIRQAGVQL